jgi:hypothetical protein
MKPLLFLTVLKSQQDSERDKFEFSSSFLKYSLNTPEKGDKLAYSVTKASAAKAS